MRKFTALILASVLCVSLAACAGEPGGNTGGETPDLTGEVTGEISISCYDTMTYKSFLEEAIQKFEEKYPGTKVNLETFSAMPEIQTSEGADGTMLARVTMEDDPQGRADYINKVGTSLMSGNGADIYAIDVLPAYKYAESKQLEDLSSYMDADPEFDRADYMSNVIDAVKYKGGTWFMPLDYTFKYYTYDSTLLSDSAARWGTGSKFNTRELLDLGKDAFDAGSEAANLFSLYDYTQRGDSLFSQLLADNYKNYVDLENKEANFTDGAFAELMESIKQYAADGYVPEGVAAMQRREEAMASGGPEGPGGMMGEGPGGAVGEGGTGGNQGFGGPAATDRFFFKLNDQMKLQQYFNKDSGLRMGFTIGGGSALGIEDDDKIAGIQADANGDVPFTFRQAYGINAASQNKATAWAFIKFLLSYEQQSSTSSGIGSLPLNNAARARMAELQIGGAFMGGAGMTFRSSAGGENGNGQQPPDAPDPETLELTDEQRAVLEQYWEAVEAMSTQINTYKFTDTIIDDMLASETQSFFDGSKPAGDVASALQNKADLYLNE